MGFKSLFNNPKWVMSMAKNILSTPIQSYKTISDISNYKIRNIEKPTMILLSDRDEFFNRRGIPDEQFKDKDLMLLPLYGNHVSSSQKEMGNYVNGFLEGLWQTDNNQNK